MKSFLCAIAGRLAISAPASATIIVGSATGVLANGSADTGGDFGAPGSLAGKEFTFNFSYDTALLTWIDTATGLIRGVGGGQYGQADFFTKAEAALRALPWRANYRTCSRAGERTLPPRQPQQLGFSECR